MAKIFANRGEWSELYAMLELLHTGKLYSADSNLKKDSIYSEVLRILRDENSGHKDYYVANSSTNKVVLYLNNNKIKEFERRDIEDFAKQLYKGIKIACSTSKKDKKEKQQLIEYHADGKKGAFYICNADTIMQTMCCERVAEPSSSKTDITMELHDPKTACKSVCGFSIKSYIGQPPTLLNASNNTNFKFEIVGNFNDFDIDVVNQMKDAKNHAAISDRVKYVLSKGCTFRYADMISDKFCSNLRLVDGDMENIIADMVRISYEVGELSCQKLIRLLWRDNKLNYPLENFYVYKFKKMLCAIALGMVPKKAWDGQEEANAGYIVVKDDGDVVAYYLYDRNTFMKYLMENTVFERGSSSKHNFAKVYKENGHYYMNLNLQIRFTKK